MAAHSRHHRLELRQRPAMKSLSRSHANGGTGILHEASDNVGRSVDMPATCIRADWEIINLSAGALHSSFLLSALNVVLAEF